MSILSLRDDMKDALAAGVSDFAAVYTHGGRFDLDELKRWAVKSPCALIGPLNISEVRMEGGQTVAAIDWGCYIVAKDTPTMKRDAMALTLVGAALAVINPEQCWDDDDAHVPGLIKAQNLYGGKLDGNGVALWAITWTQALDINAFDASQLEDFLRYRENADVPTSEIAVDLPATE